MSSGSRIERFRASTAARGLAVGDEVRAAIASSGDATVLTGWLRRAALVAAAADVLKNPS